MLPTTTFSPFNNSTTLLNITQSNSLCSLPFTTKSHSCFLSGLSLKNSSFIFCFKYLHFQHSYVNLNAIRSNGFGVCASSKKRGHVGDVNVVESEDFEEEGGDSDNEFVDFDDVEDGDDDGDGDGDEGVVMPLEQMTKWLKNKPRGFGVGKVYDTSIEDKLLDEMLKSREAQAANLNKLKSNPSLPGVKKDEEKKGFASALIFFTCQVILMCVSM